MFTTTAYFPGYPQSQAPATSGMNASQTPIPDHSQLNMAQAPPMTGGFPHEYPDTIAKTKRKQVKNACINCQKACKKCDEQRPCPRCVKYGLTETCVDSVRKERKKGIKRGPYKKRKQGGTASGDSSSATTPNMSLPPMSNGMYAPPSTGVAGVNRGANAPIPYQAYGNTGHFETFPNFANGAHPYYAVLNNMIQQAAATANVNGASKENSQQQESQPQPQQQQQQQQQQQPSTKPDEGGENKAATETDENGKLSILSQLCTAVLDRAPNGDGGDANANKKEGEQAKSDKDDSKHESTPPQSTGHSRESTTAASTEHNPTDDQPTGSSYGTPESTSETGDNN